MANKAGGERTWRIASSALLLVANLATCGSTALARREKSAGHKIRWQPGGLYSSPTLLHFVAPVGTHSPFRLRSPCQCSADDCAVTVNGWAPVWRPRFWDDPSCGCPGSGRTPLPLKRAYADTVRALRSHLKPDSRSPVASWRGPAPQRDLARRVAARCRSTPADFRRGSAGRGRG
jgi:hypothetical protein